MKDDEKVEILLKNIADAVNAAPLPLSVKALALENVLFRVKEVMLQEKLSSDQKSQVSSEGDAK